MVAALILDNGDRVAIHRALGRRTTVRLCERADAFRSMLAVTDVRLVVSELRDRVGAAVLPVLIEQASRADAPPIIVRASLADGAADDLIQLATARIPARVSVRDAAPISDAVLAALGGRGEPSADLVILERVGPSVPPPVRAFLVLCAVSPSPRLYVERAATLLGVSRRTLENRLALGALPPAHSVIAWCVVLHAAWQLDVLGHRPKEVAANLGFASGAAVANLLRRYCGCSARSLRNHGGFQTQLERFAALVQPNLRTE